jgi:hypothetical protein
MTPAPPDVVLSPPHARPFGRVHRLLVPLDGTRETAEALVTTVETELSAGVDVTVLHVHDPAGLPLFTD